MAIRCRERANLDISGCISGVRLPGTGAIAFPTHQIGSACQGGAIKHAGFFLAKKIPDGAIADGAARGQDQIAPGQHVGPVLFSVFDRDAAFYRADRVRVKIQNSNREGRSQSSQESRLQADQGDSGLTVVLPDVRHKLGSTILRLLIPAVNRFLDQAKRAQNGIQAGDEYRPVEV
jgi:hypothetical protein